MATATRGPARAHRVAMAAALVMGWRSDGTSTAGPSPIEVVRSAARVSVIQTSGYSAGESYAHARSYPISSATRMWSAVAGDVANEHDRVTVTRGLLGGGRCAMAVVVKFVSAGPRP